MFELDAAIANWKNQLTLDADIADRQVEELEMHVRDAIEVYTAKGLTDREAFIVATQMLGDGSVLKQEFRKVHGSAGTATVVYWGLVGFIGGKAIETVIAGISRSASTTSALSGLSGSVAGFMGVLAMILCWSAVLLFLWRRSFLHTVRSQPGYLPRTWLAMLVIAIIIGSAVNTAAQIGHAQISAATDVGTSVLWLGIGNAAVQVGVFVLGLGLLVVIAQKSQPRVSP